ncbi:MAG TPA: hypothetical protein VD994_07570 [Prosthecobacter sp.]|nr:hypothetical protein [Prosthecobacter sp.]
MTPETNRTISGKCCRCGAELMLDIDGCIPTHDFPKGCRSVCAGSGLDPAVESTPETTREEIDEAPRPALNVERLLEWIDDPNRKSPEAAFTSGDERRIADMILLRFREESKELGEAMELLRELLAASCKLGPDTEKQEALRGRASRFLARHAKEGR